MTRRHAIIVGILSVIGIIFSIPMLKWVLQRIKQPRLEKLDVYKPLLDELVETIIPRTDTPGAQDVGVADFVIGKVCYFLSKSEQNAFIMGLEDLDRRCMIAYGRPFIACSVQQRLTILDIFEENGGGKQTLLFRIKRKFFGNSFIDSLKTFTIEGYCTSQIGVTQCLAYDPIPIVYQSCIEMVPNQRSWATK